MGTLKAVTSDPCMTHDTRIALFLIAELVTALAARQLKHQLQRFITEGPPSLDDTQPRPSSHPRICDREGVCQVIRGMWAAQHLTEDIREPSATKTKCSEDWVEEFELLPI